MQNGSRQIPVMLYDGDCGFCAHWVHNWRKATGDLVRYEPYQKVIAEYPQVTEGECRKAVQLIMPGAAVFSGAHAVFKALAMGGRRVSLLWLYEHAPLFGAISELIYQIIARSRSLLSKLYGSNKCKV